MSKEIDLNKTVAELVKEYPEVKEVMIQLGFKDLANPVALQIMGRKVTIPQGAAMKGIPMERIVLSFEAHGFTVKGQEPSVSETPAQPQMHRVRLSAGPQMSEGAKKLSVYLERLNNGESVDDVRDDFAKEFDTVPVNDIMQAEQQLINTGADPRKLKNLCDLHSTLFHGRSEDTIIKEESRIEKIDLTKIPVGHPVRYFIQENTGLTELLDEVNAAAEGDDSFRLMKDLNMLRKIRTYYGKKEELLMPVLERDGVTGPAQVMWAVDDEMKNQVGALVRQLQEEGMEKTVPGVKALIQRMKEMQYKDENILLPSCLDHFTKEEWYAVYRDTYEMGPVFISIIPDWPEADEYWKQAKAKEEKGLEEGTVRFHGDGVTSPAGTLTVKQLKAMLKVLPVDITFIDDEETNRFYKNTDRVFSRPQSTLDQKTFYCHPPVIRTVVDKLIDDFRNGKKDSFERYIPSERRPVRILYLAVRDEEGNYIGTVEVVQDLTKIRDALNIGPSRLKPQPY